jgi:cyclophilin family peptidyl-prolyl cis-trans isomerase
MSRSRRRSSRRDHLSPSGRCEPLERRLLLSADAPVITDYFADNRGLIELTVDQALNASTVTRDAFTVMTPGDDQLLGTADDQFVLGLEVTYSAATRTISVDSNLAADTPYSVTINGDFIRGMNGCFLDAEFNGSGEASGDGVEGGSGTFFSRSTGPTLARIVTNFGAINIELFPGETPITVENFFRYANDELYDGTIIHRSASLQDGTPFVIQGGGFENGVQFLPIPTFDPILNEPGISNVRGTIAMAKLGGDPNSATSQWFFNLGDNSANLDNQNGGFTVFGEVVADADLEVIDMIAALETFNASQTNSAFNEVPVDNLPAVEAQGFIQPSDVVQIFRVSRVVQVDAEPFGQIDTDEVRTITQTGSTARVTLYSLTNTPLGDLDRFIDVRFGGGNTINRITITEDLPAPVGIQISGAEGVGSIVDRRRGGEDANLSFIVSTSSVGSIRLSQTITGFNLNGLLLADNLLLPEDVDGDNVFNDNTSILIQSGATDSVRIDADYAGDMLIPGGLLNLRINGDARNADIDLGNDELNDSMDVRVRSVRDVDLTTGTPIRNLRADEWIAFNTASASIVAPSILRMNVRGDFGADLDLSGEAVVGGSTLAVANVRGDVLRARWNIVGDVNRLRMGDTSNLQLNVQGDVIRFIAGDVGTSDIAITGVASRVIADEMVSSTFSAGGAELFVLRRGDLSADVTIGDDAARDMRAFRVRGDVENATIELADPVRRFSVGGDFDTVTINANDFNILRLNSLTDTDLSVSGDLRQLRVLNWDGGSVQAGAIDVVQVTGSNRLDLPGDFNADLAVNFLRSVDIAGDLRADDFRAGDVRNLDVGGDVVDSTISFFQIFFASQALGSMHVGGAVIGSNVLVQTSADDISVAGLIDSGIYVGTLQPQTGFPNANAIFSQARVDSVVIRGIGEGVDAMDNGFIVGGTIGYARVTNPSANGAFGIAGFTVEQVDVLAPDLRRTFTNPQTAQVVLGGLQIRPGFQQPQL